MLLDHLAQPQPQAVSLLTKLVVHAAPPLAVRSGDSCGIRPLVDRQST